MKFGGPEKIVLRAVKTYGAAKKTGDTNLIQAAKAGLEQVVASSPGDAVARVERCLKNEAKQNQSLSAVLAEMRQAPRNQASVVSTAAEAAEKPQSSPTAVQQPGTSLLQAADVLGEKYYIDPRLGFCPVRQPASQDS